MTSTVLVTYATRYGSTQEVAETVATSLRQHGLEVELRPMREVKTLDGYGAVVMGAPLYIGRWPNDVCNFLERFREALVQRAVMVFTLGPTQPDLAEWEGVRTQLQQQMAKYAWLQPVSLELFGGRYDPALLRFPDSLLAMLPASPLHNLPANDVRDWEAIRAWSDKLVTQLEHA